MVTDSASSPLLEEPARRRRSARSFRSRTWPPPTRAYRVFQVANLSILLAVIVLTLYPFIHVIAWSFSSKAYIDAGQVNLIPRGFNLTTYHLVLTDRTFWIGYRNTVVYAVVGTFVSMFLTTTYAYVLSKRHLRGRGLLIGIAVFTLFFSGGLIPTYVVVTSLGLRDTIWAIALPNAISVFNLLVMKAFFESLPVELEEAAAIDGVDTYRILLRITMPLSKAVIATMTLFYAVYYWNSWFSAFLYMDQNEVFPVTIYLRNLIAGATGSTNAGAPPTSDLAQATGANIQSVTIVLTMLPIVLVYPFVQRYFIKGVVLGAVKG